MVLSLKRVLVSDEVDQKCVDILQRNAIHVDKKTGLSKEQLLLEIPKYDGLIVRSATKVTEDVINAATNLKLIGRAGTGVDNINCNAATRKGIIVMNTPRGNTLSAAEHTCAMICSLSREIPLATQSLKEGRWDRKKFMGSELNGKTLAIIGLGRIGREVAFRMQSFGMKTIGFDPLVSAEESAVFKVESLPLEKIWPQSDYITVHTPLIPQTRNLINDVVFSLCRKGVRIINCARGGIIEEAALLRALESGQCGGAALDVYEQEPPTNVTLIQHPKVISTPHLGANTTEAQSRVAVEIAEQFVDLVHGKSLVGVINAPSLTNALSPESQPWVALAQNLGVVVSAFCEGPRDTWLQLTLHGSLQKSTESYLKAATLAGYLRSSSTMPLNLVNSSEFAKELGIKVSATYHDGFDPSPFGAFLTLAVHMTNGPVICVSGTASGGCVLLTDINGVGFDVPCSLKNSFIVFRVAAKSQILTQLTGALHDAGAVVVGFSITTGPGENWGVVNLISPIGDLSSIQPLVQQVVEVNL